MSSALLDNIQWLSTTEETLFLHDGLIRVAELIELPRDVNSRDASDIDYDAGVITFDSKSPIDVLADRLKTLCNTSHNAYAKLLEYRMNGLRGFWNARYQIALEVQKDRERTTPEETLMLLRKQGLLKEPDQASFSTRVSLLMVLPLIHSQSKLDSGICGTTAKLLLLCLNNCPPLSLSNEPSDCLDGLESLLCIWLGEKGQNTSNANEVENDVAPHRIHLASALVVLTCAR